MKKLLVIAATLLVGCGALSKRDARTALDIVEMTCALTHAEMFDSKTVADACGIAEALIPSLDKLLESRRRAAVLRAQQRGACE